MTTFCPCSVVSILILVFLTQTVAVALMLLDVVTMSYFIEAIPATRPNMSANAPPDVWLDGRGSRRGG